MARLNVLPPTQTSSPFGLLSVVQARYDSPDPHWRNGVQWQPLCGDLGTTYDPAVAITGVGAPPPPPDKTSSLTDEVRGATPFTVYAAFDSSPAAWAAEAQRRADEAMARMEGFDVERAFWTGVSGGQQTVWPHLAANAEQRDTYGMLLQTAATPVTGVALDVVEAVGRLEQGLAGCLKGAGVLHVPLAVLTAMASKRLVFRDGQQLKTFAGNAVAAGAGYPGTSPDGSAPATGSAWMYATGPVFAYRSRVEIPEPLSAIMNRSNNTATGLAERTYVLGFDCCLFAALVSTGGTVAGAPNSAGGLP